MKKTDSLTVGYNGEHATSVNGTAIPNDEDFIEVGIKNKLTRKSCLEIIARIRECCSNAIPLR